MLAIPRKPNLRNPKPSLTIRCHQLTTAAIVDITCADRTHQVWTNIAFPAFPRSQWPHLSATFSSSLFSSSSFCFSSSSFSSFTYSPIPLHSRSSVVHNNHALSIKYNLIFRFVSLRSPFFFLSLPFPTLFVITSCSLPFRQRTRRGRCPIEHEG